MKRLDPDNKLFKKLAKNPPRWWNLLVSEKNIYIEIRKENYIDVYYNGGNIITGLNLKKNKFSGSIHYKYLLPEGTKYINYEFPKDKWSLSPERISLLSFPKIDNKSLKRIKDNISNHYSANSEKGIQARFILKSGAFIDSEFAYNFNKDDKDLKCRIDLVWIDITNQKIVFVELKTMGDSRLFNDEIKHQLQKYSDFISNFKDEIEEYYKMLFQIKKSLSILPAELKHLQSIDGFVVEKKPLLLFGDCSQDWIDSNSKDINKKIKDIALGAYYFGKPGYSCDIVPKTIRNRFIF